MDYQPLPQKKRTWPKVIFGVLFTLSVLTNFLLILAVAGLVIFAAIGGTDRLMEQTIADGPMDQKIAVINIDGIIDLRAENHVKDQLDSASADNHVKAIIVKICSPGGGVSASDNIYHYIKSYKNQTQKPVICYMDGLAASGGYYVAVACDEIIASPTTITGSIGVIMGHMDISNLLEQKLGIVPTTLKSGEKKDWPSMFRQISEEEKVYLYNKVIEPAYKRFVELVNTGRENLSFDEVMNLADGSIYFADEALDKGLVDSKGYFENAIAIAMEKAGIASAKVVEYQRPFSLSDFMSSQSKSVINFDSKTLIEMTTPELMYLWTGRN